MQISYTVTNEACKLIATLKFRISGGKVSWRSRKHWHSLNVVYPLGADHAGSLDDGGLEKQRCGLTSPSIVRGISKK